MNREDWKCLAAVVFCVVAVVGFLVLVDQGGKALFQNAPKPQACQCWPCKCCPGCSGPKAGEP